MVSGVGVVKSILGYLAEKEVAMPIQVERDLKISRYLVFGSMIIMEELGLLLKDKKLPVLSPRELVAYVNLPTALDTLPVKTASIILGPPPEIP